MLSPPNNFFVSVAISITSGGTAKVFVDRYPGFMKSSVVDGVRQHTSNVASL
jgi:hypothetical protein